MGPTKVLTMLRMIFAALLLAAVTGPAFCGSARAQGAAAPGDPMSAKLSAEKVGDVETGQFSAGEKLSFVLDPYGDKYLLRFDDSPEAYVLSEERVVLGGRILRYDTGVIALRVSVWGGMTLYTGSAPGGLPATRTGDNDAPPQPAVSRTDFIAAMADEEKHLAYTQQLQMRFSADPAVLAGGDEGLAFDALISAEAGIERLLAMPGGRAALAHKFDSVRIVQGDKPGVSVSGKTMVVAYAPGAGAAGRASSREIALQLSKMLQVAEAR